MKKIPTLLVLGAAMVASFIPMQQAQARDYYVQAPGTYIRVGRPNRYYRTYDDNGWRRHRGWFHRHHRDWDRRFSNRSDYYRWY